MVVIYKGDSIKVENNWRYIKRRLNLSSLERLKSKDVQ